MSFITVIALTICVSLSVFVGVYLGKNIKLASWKRAVIIVIGAIGTIAGMLVLNWIENGTWGGISYFGAHFMAPLTVALACLVFGARRTEILDMIDLVSLILSFSIVLIKINCMIHGCCRGRVLWTDERGFNVLFPSQIAECLNALLITAFLIYCIRKGKHRGMLMPLFYAVYGVTRFYLHLLRDTRPFALGLPAGNLWSLLSIFVSIVWMYIRYLRVSNEKMARAHRSRAGKRLG